jgi:hypothetical protein
LDGNVLPRDSGQYPYPARLPPDNRSGTLLKSRDLP